MKRPDVIVIEGRAYSWRVILELRWAQPQQSPLFELKEDRRPAAERSAAGRYREPTLLSLLQERPP